MNTQQAQSWHRQYGRPTVTARALGWLVADAVHTARRSQTIKCATVQPVKDAK